MFGTRYDRCSPIVKCRKCEKYQGENQEYLFCDKRKLRRRVLKDFYVCPFCGDVIHQFSLEDHISQHVFDQWKRQVTLNWRIIENPNIQKFRRNLAVYRLYRYLGFNLHMLSRLTGLKYDAVQRIIGETFKLLCLTDQQCIFKKFFER
jgi:hypothetical protein